MSMLVYRCQNGLAPRYLSGELHRVADVGSWQRLHSAATAALIVPHILFIPRSATMLFLWLQLAFVTVTPNLQCSSQQEPCTDPHYKKYFCRNGGICCELFGEPSCVCPSAPYYNIGTRCEFLSSSDSKDKPLLFNAMAFFSVLVIILVVLLLLLIGYLVVRARRHQLRCCCCIQSPNTLNDSTKDIMRKRPASRQPGLSWRQTTCRRYMSKALSSSFGDVSRQTAINTDRMTIRAGLTLPSTGDVDVKRGDPEAAHVVSEKSTSFSSSEQSTLDISDERNLMREN